MSHSKEERRCEDQREGEGGEKKTNWKKKSIERPQGSEDCREAEIRKGVGTWDGHTDHPVDTSLTDGLCITVNVSQPWPGFLHQHRLKAEGELRERERDGV